MDLNSIIELMQSSDYKDRFRAEYWQLKIRIEKLEKMLCEWEEGSISFEPTCPYEVLASQLSGMRAYMHMLRIRARLENINIE